MGDQRVGVAVAQQVQQRRGGEAAVLALDEKSSASGRIIELAADTIARLVVL